MDSMYITKRKEIYDWLSTIPARSKPTQQFDMFAEKVTPLLHKIKEYTEIGDEATTQKEFSIVKEVALQHCMCNTSINKFNSVMLGGSGINLEDPRLHPVLKHANRVRITSKTWDVDILHKEVLCVEDKHVFSIRIGSALHNLSALFMLHNKEVIHDLYDEAIVQATATWGELSAVLEETKDKMAIFELASEL